jgi:hypothetical protein
MKLPLLLSNSINILDHGHTGCSRDLEILLPLAE